MKQVHHLKPVNTAPEDAGRVALPRPLSKARDVALTLLGKYLTSMMDGADDTLFDLAEAAHSHEQDRYFNAMRELRVQRSGVEANFQQALQNAFLALTQNEPKAAEKKIDFESLALVNDEEVEVEVAISNMARRVRQACEEQLRIFNHRLEYLFEGRKVFGEEKNPLEPQQVARCFEESLARLHLDIGTKLIIFKLFERVVLAELGYVVTEANNVLIDAGILPDLKAPPIAALRQPSSQYRGPTSESMAPSQEQAMAPTAQMFNMLQELLSALHSVAHARQGVPSVRSEFDAADVAVMQGGTPMLHGAPIAPGTPIKAISSDELVHLLDKLQTSEVSEEATADAQPDLRGELASLMTEEHQGMVPALDQADDDVINLVAMLFDFILDDSNLSGDIKALLGRLQIPLLKVAVVDKGFFSDEQHAARGLLNALARAGAQWSPEQGKEDELYQQIYRTIEAVLAEPNADSTRFEELLHEFDYFMRQRNARSKRLEARVREMEEGRFITAQAKKTVAQTLGARLAGHALPAVVLDMLQQGWQQVMHLIYLREGEDSLAWQQALRVVDAVVWSVNVGQDPVQLKRLRSIGPRLIRNLQKGFEEVAYDTVTVKEWLKALHGVLANIQKGESLERTLVEAEQEAAPEPLATDDPRVKQMMQLRVGQWITVEQENGDALRCKLAANLREGEKLIFINARGIKVAEYDAVSLALAVHEGKVKLIDEGALFDRALEAVINDLRQRQAALS